jgi:hypothetical protein
MDEPAIFILSLNFILFYTRLNSVRDIETVLALILVLKFAISVNHPR